MSMVHRWGFVYATLLCAAMAHGADVPFLANDPANAQWSASAATSDAVWLGGQPRQSAVLVIRKIAVIPGSVTIESDAKVCALHTPDGRPMAMPLSAEHVTTFVFGTSGDRPTLKLGDQEVPALRGAWIAIAGDPSDKMVLEIPGATYATVRFAPPAQPAPATAPATRPGSAVPPLVRRGNAAQVSSAARAISNGLTRKCPDCDGKGTVTKKTQAGYENGDSFISRPVFTEEIVTCEKCNGTKIVRMPDEAVDRLSGQLVKSIAVLNLDDRSAQRALSDAYRVLTEIVIGDKQAWIMLNGRGRGVVAQKRIDLNTPIMVQAKFVQSAPSERDVDRTYDAVIAGTDQIVRVVSPVTAEEVRPGLFVLIGGVFEQVVQGEKGERVVVLRHGFVVAPNIPKDWTWWWEP